ncbi:MAG: SPOR domain-containing protein [Rhodospirillales bacterium]
MALPGKTNIKVTASDALEFEPVAPEPRKRRWGLKLFLLLVLAAGASWGWLIYGHEIRAIWAGGASGVPLVKAAAGPVKVRPENPGGLKVPDRDKLVYDRIGGASDGKGAARGPERLLPPPEQPLPKPGPDAGPAVEAPAADQATTPAKAEAVPVKRKPTPKTKPVPTVPTVKDVKSAKRPLPPPPPTAPPTSNPTPSPVLSAARNATEKSGKQKAAKVPAKPKPEQAPAAAPATAPAPAPARAPTPAPASAPTETARATAAPTPAAPRPSARAYLVQLAAARSPKGARDEWERLRGKHKDLLGNLGLRVTKADLGPTRGIFYRLRAGPLSDEAAARQLCQELAKRQVGCLIIKPVQ